MSGLRQIAFYGKGGIGKSTTSQNTLAADDLIALRRVQPDPHIPHFGSWSSPALQTAVLRLRNRPMARLNPDIQGRP